MGDAGDRRAEHIRRADRRFAWFLRLTFALWWGFLSFMGFLGVVEPFAGSRPWPSGLGLAYFVMLASATAAATWIFRDELLGRPKDEALSGAG